VLYLRGKLAPSLKQPPGLFFNARSSYRGAKSEELRVILLMSRVLAHLQGGRGANKIFAIFAVNGFRLYKQSE